MQTLRESKPKARKEHKCDFCCEKIKKGEVYNSQTNVYDGDIYVWKTHKKCSEIAAELRMYDNCDEGVGQSEFWDYITEEYQDLMIKTNLKKYESKGFKIPSFLNQLNFVFNYHLK